MLSKSKLNIQELHDFLKKKHDKQGVLDLTSEVNEKSVHIEDLYQLSVRNEDEQIAFRAAWVIENVFFSFPKHFVPILKTFLKDYPTQKNRSVQRHYSKIAYQLTKTKPLFFTKDEINGLIDGSFDWLIDTETPVAVQCNCIDVLFNLSNQEDWIMPELQRILEQNLLSNSPAILSRTKKILNKLQN